jgi:hypothetical protein
MNVTRPVRTWSAAFNAVISRIAAENLRVSSDGLVVELVEALMRVGSAGRTDDRPDVVVCKERLQVGNLPFAIGGSFDVLGKANAQAVLLEFRNPACEAAWHVGCGIRGRRDNSHCVAPPKRRGRTRLLRLST